MRRLLVANRGEIALRVFRACRAEGAETVAVVAPDDTGALHACSADAVVEISSYLDPAEYVRAARESEADAVHPGYGFLSESPELAEAVLDAGLTWVGPPPAALRAGGDKLAAKETARAAGIPVLPNGTPDEIGFPLLVKAAAGGGGRGMRVVRAPDELDEALRAGGDKLAAKAAARAAGVPVLPEGDPATVGFPLVVKAAGGGGGRGMRVVREPGELAEALAAARREAKAAFGDDTVFCERYLERPRHVEIQILADTHGDVVTLGERDCSIQRRHQKVLEESPSPALDEPLRALMSEAALAFARAVGYANAGTA
ncbi:MAG TPA: biotin carboxylase N-terminal domain-containing protein, partial [Gaiellaceae bacterium]|nr:biotin carboxylase N-terminal domain-containing protein [Gaiellaceae bacterium]